MPISIKRTRFGSLKMRRYLEKNGQRPLCELKSTKSLVAFCVWAINESVCLKCEKRERRYFERPGARLVIVGGCLAVAIIGFPPANREGGHRHRFRHDC